jgi:hypothetical protein
MQEQLGLFEEAYSLIVNFAQRYSFQSLGVLIAGFIVGSGMFRVWLASCIQIPCANVNFGCCQTKNW